MTRTERDRTAALAASEASQAKVKQENDLFPGTKPPRAKPRVMAHVFDAGCSCENNVARFKCRRCSWQSEWMSVASISDGKRGIGCHSRWRASWTFFSTCPFSQPEAGLQNSVSNR